MSHLSFCLAVMSFSTLYVWKWVDYGHCSCVRMIFFKLDDISFMLQVSDFGLANHADFNPSGGRFPIKWTAPEALRDNVSFFSISYKNYHIYR